MNLFDQNSNSFVKVVMAKIDSGSSCALPATPLEVRVFDSSHLNGELIGWEYNNGICYLDRPLVAGETAKFYSIDGLPLFDSETFVNNLSSERVKEIEVSFIDSFDVRDFLFEVDDLFGSDVSFQWKEGEGSYQDFPISKEYLQKDTYHEFTIKAEIDPNIAKSNYRNVDFHLTCRRVGDE